jgi:hypothetical protein
MRMRAGVPPYPGAAYAARVVRIMTALAALKVALATIMRTELEHLRVEC